jgi:hypothetical protein
MTADITPENVARHLDLSHNHEAGLIPVATQNLLTALSARLAEVEAEQHKWWKHCRAAEKRAEAAEAKLAEVEALLKMAEAHTLLNSTIAANNLTRAEAAEAREAKLREELAKASNRLEWCSGILPYEINRDKASAWADEASAALQVKP